MNLKSYRDAVKQQNKEGVLLKDKINSTILDMYSNTSNILDIHNQIIKGKVVNFDKELLKENIKELLYNCFQIEQYFGITSFDSNSLGIGIYGSNSRYNLLISLTNELDLTKSIILNIYTIDNHIQYLSNVENLEDFTYKISNNLHILIQKLSVLAINCNNTLSDLLCEDFMNRFKDYKEKPEQLKKSKTSSIHNPYVISLETTVENFTSNIPSYFSGTDSYLSESQIRQDQKPTNSELDNE